MTNTMEAITLENKTNGLIKDGSIPTFVQDVLEASKTALVLVDFWATWCGPCKQLTPVLEKIVRDFGGKVKLVKIDIDQNKQLAAQLGVQSVPMVYAFQDGQPVDAFMGAIPERELRAFVDRLLGGEGKQNTEDTLKAAKTELDAGNVAGAAMLYQQILSNDAENTLALAGLGLCFLKSGDAARAQDILNKIPEKLWHLPDVMALIAALELSSGANNDTAALEQKVKQNPKDQQARLDLACAYAAANKMEPAIEILLQSIKFDRKWNEEAARQKIVKILDTLGFDHPLAGDTRRKLSSILFS
ncbi:MAG: thioredoxin [Alphaproteobacteria bacterium]|nr:MAG: thioredoxin [Alphaproteobacteria bacterium]